MCEDGGGTLEEGGRGNWKGMFGGKEAFEGGKVRRERRRQNGWQLCWRETYRPQLVSSGCQSLKQIKLTHHQKQNLSSL